MKKQLLAKANNAKSELVKGCVDRLKQIEGRLDNGCVPAWLKGLDTVSDMLGVAQRLLPLQKLTSMVDGEGAVPWLQEAIGPPGGPPGENADDAAELSRRVLRLLDDVDRAVAPARDPVGMLGEVVLKHFEGHGMFMGTIVEYDQHTGFRLQYDDGDTEDMSLRDLRALMSNLGGGGEGAGAGGGAAVGAPMSRKKQMQAAASASSGVGAAAPVGVGGKSSAKGGSSSKPVSRTASADGGVPMHAIGQKRALDLSGVGVPIEKLPKAANTSGGASAAASSERSIGASSASVHVHL